MTYSNRIYGAALIKAINSNYNADFSGQPRTLPNGVVYATDKALKYAIKNFIKENYPFEKVFYFKRFNEEFIPYSLDDAFVAVQYRDWWYWIDDRDFFSKRVFGFIMFLFTLVEEPSTEGTPIVTIPAG